MSAAKRQNTLSGFPFTCTCVRVCLVSVLVRHHCQRQEDKTHLACVCECVLVCVPVLCAQPMNPSLKAALLPLCLPCRYNYKGHLTFKPHSLSPRVHMWPVFLLQLNDWMHLHRFLLTSSPIWNLVPVRSAQNEHIHTDVQAHTHAGTHLRLRLQKALSVRFQRSGGLVMISV